MILPKVLYDAIVEHCESEGLTVCILTRESVELDNEIQTYEIPESTFERLCAFFPELEIKRKPEQ